MRSFPAGPKPLQVGATIPGSGRVVTSAILAAGAGDASHAVLAMTSDELFRAARAGLPPQKTDPEKTRITPELFGISPKFFVGAPAFSPSGICEALCAPSFPVRLHGRKWSTSSRGNYLGGGLWPAGGGVGCGRGKRVGVGG